MRGRLRVGSLLAIVGMAGAGVVTFIEPSPSLMRYAGGSLVVIFGVLCLSGATVGLVAITTKRVLFGLIGAALGASAGATYCGSLIIQAVQTRSAAPLTAAGFALVVVGMVVQRWMDAMRKG